MQYHFDSSQLFINTKKNLSIMIEKKIFRSNFLFVDLLGLFLIYIQIAAVIAFLEPKFVIA